MNKNVVIALTLLIAACSRDNSQPAEAPRAPENAAPASTQTARSEQTSPGAAAQLGPTQGNAVTGSLALASSAEGVHITGSVQGLKPDAEFGFHIHEKGDCSAPDGSSAGGHFNPSQQQHGNPTGGAHHAGDMPNIRSNAEGVAQVDTTAASATVHGDPASDVIGKAIVVHEGPDDYTTQPSGNSGKRVACGVIAAATAP
jgi:superoxide dismutase, Cu-Zn family